MSETTHRICLNHEGYSGPTVACPTCSAPPADAAPRVPDITDEMLGKILGEAGRGIRDAGGITAGATPAREGEKDLIEMLRAEAIQECHFWPPDPDPDDEDFEFCYSLDEYKDTPCDACRLNRWLRLGAQALEEIARARGRA